jgi:hypothetical protein
MGVTGMFLLGVVCLSSWAAFVVFAFGGLVTLILLGFALDQIPDPDMAGTIEFSEEDKAEQGERPSRRGSSSKPKNGRR